MARTDPQTVAKTFDADLDTSDGGPVDQWIDMASDLVDDVAAADSSLSSARLTNIETLVAQHFLAAQHPRATDQEGGARSASYGEGRAETAYLDRAKRLDPTGVIAESLASAQEFTLST